MPKGRLVVVAAEGVARESVAEPVASVPVSSQDAPVPARSIDPSKVLHVARQDARKFAQLLSRLFEKQWEI
jgi:hypothetical protein